MIDSLSVRLKTHISSTNMTWLRLDVLEPMPSKTEECRVVEKNQSMQRKITNGSSRSLVIGVGF